MKFTKHIVKPLSLMAIVIICLYACKPEKKGSLELYENSSGICNPVSSWFPHTQTPAPDESTNAFNKNTSNAGFHQWSWQKFLWLTKPASQTDNTPLFLRSPEEIFQVTDLMMDTITVPKGSKIVLLYDEQACSNGVLQTNPKFVSETNTKIDTIFYSIHTNSIMMDAAIGYKNLILHDPTLEKENDFVFPVGSFELKASWAPTSAIPAKDLGNYYVTEAAYIVNNKYVYKEVAMLGIHVVGVVANHPEFIWATFQHDDLATVYDWGADIAEQHFNTLIYEGEKPSILDGITWDSSANPPAPEEALSAYELFQYGVPLNEGGSFMETSQEEPTNYKNIDSLNICVLETFKDKDSKDVWKNYFYNGSIWINTDDFPTTKQQADTIRTLGSSISSVEKGDLARGSANCANVTMETFTQTFESEISDIDASNLVNCFTCHNSGKVSPLYLSHLFKDNIKASKGMTSEQIEASKNQEHLELLKFLKKK